MLIYSVDKQTYAHYMLKCVLLRIPKQCNLCFCFDFKHIIAFHEHKHTHSHRHIKDPQAHHLQSSLAGTIYNTKM